MQWGRNDAQRDLLPGGISVLQALTLKLKHLVQDGLFGVSVIEGLCHFGVLKEQKDKP